MYAYALGGYITRHGVKKKKRGGNGRYGKRYTYIHTFIVLHVSAGRFKIVSIRTNERPCGQLPHRCRKTLKNYIGIF